MDLETPPRSSAGTMGVRACKAKCDTTPGCTGYALVLPGFVSLLRGHLAEFFINTRAHTQTHRHTQTHTDTDRHTRTHTRQARTRLIRDFFVA